MSHFKTFDLSEDLLLMLSTVNILIQNDQQLDDHELEHIHSLYKSMSMGALEIHDLKCLSSSKSNRILDFLLANLSEQDRLLIYKLVIHLIQIDKDIDPKELQSLNRITNSLGFKDYDKIELADRLRSSKQVSILDLQPAAQLPTLILLFEAAYADLEIHKEESHRIKNTVSAILSNHSFNKMQRKTGLLIALEGLVLQDAISKAPVNEMKTFITFLTHDLDHREILHCLFQICFFIQTKKGKTAITPEQLAFSQSYLTVSSEEIADVFEFSHLQCTLASKGLMPLHLISEIVSGDFNNTALTRKEALDSLKVIFGYARVSEEDKDTLFYRLTDAILLDSRAKLSEMEILNDTIEILNLNIDSVTRVLTKLSQVHKTKIVVPEKLDYTNFKLELNEKLRVIEKKATPRSQS